ncbi:hypothetical protein [Actinomadura napierensis]|uniref:Uncharacterized protein n=1 Tax=Actinomadura napierensis TaxID=267854 RepID=A0ABN3AE07_9ACTN
MTSSDGYAQRIRARPYGPREVVAGGVAAWFHGPFAVLTLTAETAVTIRADLDDSPIGADLIELFDAAESERRACLPRPGLLVSEQPLAGDAPIVVRRVAVQPRAGGMSLTVETTARPVDALLSVRDAGLIVREIRRWVYRE